jgi:quercetin dioxygenase-like cupin family protein
MDEQAFRKTLAEEGYAEGRVVEWGPNHFNDTHVHDFSAKVLVLDGEITVACEDGRTTTCRAGDTFQLAAGTPHLERIGAAGVRFLSGRK